MRARTQRTMSMVCKLPTSDLIKTVWVSEKSTVKRRGKKRVGKEVGSLSGLAYGSV